MGELHAVIGTFDRIRRETETPMPSAVKGDPLASCRLCLSYWLDIAGYTSNRLPPHSTCPPNYHHTASTSSSRKCSDRYLVVLAVRAPSAAPVLSIEWSARSFRILAILCDISVRQLTVIEPLYVQLTVPLITLK